MRGLYGRGGFIPSPRVAADGAAPFAPQAPRSLHVLLAPSRGPRRARLRGGVVVTNGAVRGQDPPGGYETGFGRRAGRLMVVEALQSLRERNRQILE